MTKPDLGHVIQIVANLGVIAGIVFLAMEIRQNTASLDEARNLAMAEARQNMASQLDDSYRSLANSEYLPGIFIKYEQGGVDALTDEELLRFIWQSCSGLNRLDTLHAWHQRGYVDEAEYEAAFRSVALGFAPRWRDIGIAPIRPAFRQAIERMLAAAGMQISLPENSRC